MTQSPEAERPAPEIALAEAVLATARSMLAAGAVVGSAGNVSARGADGIHITPTRLEYDRMDAHDVVTVDEHGRRLRGHREPSREASLHVAIYQARPDVRAIVHTHSPYATAWSFLDEPLRPTTEDMEYHSVGAVRTSPTSPAGSHQLGERAAIALGGSLAVLLGQHGVVAVGSTLREARTIAAVVEHQSQIAWLLRGLRTPGEGPLRLEAASV